MIKNNFERIKYGFPWFAAALLVLSSLAAHEVPRLGGRVNDYAGMISAPVRDAIEKKLAELEQSDSTQVAVLTVPDLQGLTVEEFSMKVAEQWKIGQKKYDNGVIFLVARQERKMRIEVGYGLEGRLTDLLAGRILDYEVRPAFKAGDYDAGFIRGVDGIIQAVRGEYRGSESRGDRSSSGENSSAAMIIIALVIIMGIGARGILRGTLSGGILFPVAFLTVVPFTMATLLVLVIAGLVIGLILSLIGRAMGSGTGGGGGFGGWSGSSGGFGDSGSGWSGGGGSFGGGGASSGW